MYGIDLGTTNSVISIIGEDGRPKVIENKNGGRITPSAVLFSENEIIVGENAKKQYSMNPSHTILSVKRLMGTSEKIEIDGKFYTPEEISAKILRKLVDDANERLGVNYNQVVITVPAYFDDRQRNSTKQAGLIANLEVLRLINEPTSASLCYNADQKSDEGRVICVYDLGGGTFDVSILTIGENICEVNATAGNTQLGGDDFDKKIQEWLIEMFERDHGIQISNQPLAVSRIREESENAKKVLSESSSANIVIPFITIGKDGVPMHLNYTLTRKEFDEMISDYIKQTLDCIENVVKDAGMKKEEIDEIILVGGSTRVPAVRDALTTMFKKTPNIHSIYGVDEIVSVGASISAGIITGKVNNVILADVNPLSLGVKIIGGINEIIVKRNSSIPRMHSEIFTTSEDFQKSIEVVVLQGERALAKDNLILGKFTLDSLIEAPAGVPKIQVSFNIDVNGILTVSAKDLATENEVSITIENNSLSQEELQRMIEDGRKFADEDRNKRQLIELKNTAQRLIYQAEKTLGEYKDRLSEEVVEEVQQSIDGTRDNLDVENMEVIKLSVDVLKKSILFMGENLYKGEEK